MLNERFSDLFYKLLGRWHRYQDAPMEPERVTELARARADLDDARNETSEARRLYHPEWEATYQPDRPVRKTSVSEDDQARLKVEGLGYQSRS